MQLRFLGKVTEGGNSPTLFDTDEDMYVIQGWTIDDPATLAQLKLPDGETALIVPKALDSRRAMFNHFSGDGVPLGQEITDDPTVVELCRTAFEDVWKAAVPHHEYCI